MVEFKIQLEESFVQTLGYENIEQSLQSLMQSVILKLSAQDILQELETIDLENDEEWQLARNLAWKQEESNYFG